MVSPFVITLIDADDDLAEMLRRFEMTESIGTLVEGKNAVDDGHQPMLRDSLVHRLEHRAGTDVDPSNRERLMEDMTDLYLARIARQHANQADVTRVTRGAQSFR